MVVSYFADDSEYPRSAPPEQRNRSYWTNIAANAATFRHVQGFDPEIIVYTGDDPPADMRRVLEAAAVEVRHLPFDRRPPVDFYQRYVGSLYVLDTMRELARITGPDDVWLLADPDVVWCAPLDPLIADVRRGGIVTYDLAVPDSVPLCHHSRADQAAMWAEMTGQTAPTPPYPAFGGELYGLLGHELVEVSAAVERLWDLNMERYQAGLPHFHVEEHVINAVLHERGVREGRGNAHIQRILTVPHPFGTRERESPGLVGWHLPMEKDRGLRRLYRHVAAGRAMPPVGPAYRRWLGHKVGVKPNAARWVTDHGRRAKWAITGSARNRKPQYGL